MTLRVRTTREINAQILADDPAVATEHECVHRSNRVTKETVNHPAHYGGDTTYEVIKVLHAWGLEQSFCLGNAIKYIARHMHKAAPLEDLKKARWYLDEKIKQMEKLT